MGQLRALEIEEVSLVGRPANKRKFLLFKSQEGGSDMPDIPNTEERDLALEAAINEPLPDEAELLAKMDLPEDQRDLVAVGLRLLAKGATAAGEGVKDLLAKVGFGHTKAETEPEATEEDKPDPAEAEKPEPENTEGGSAVNEEVNALLKARDDEIATLRAENETLAKSVQGFDDFRKSVLEKEDDRAVGELIEKYALPGDREKLRAFLKGLSPEQRGMWAEQQQPSLEAIRRLEREIGTSARGNDDSASRVLERAVDEALAKSDTPSQANADGVKQVLAALHVAAGNDPVRIRELYDQMRAEEGE